MPCRKCGGALVNDTCSRCGPQQRPQPRTIGRILAIRSVDGLKFRSGAEDDSYEDIEARCPEVAGGERGFAEIQPRPGRSSVMVWIQRDIGQKPEAKEAQLSLF